MSLLEETISAICPADNAAREKARQHILNLTMPRWALGRLLDLAVDLAGMTGNFPFETSRKRIVLMAGDHGIVKEGVCPQPSSVTVQMVRNFVRGGGSINALAAGVGAEVTVADFGMIQPVPDLVEKGTVLDCRVAGGTRDFMNGPAMSNDQAVQSLENGIRLARKFAPETDIFGSGEMGIGNTTPSTAILAVLGNVRDIASIVGPGAGLPENRLGHKAEVIARGIACNRPDPVDGLDILSKVGGFEIGGIAGLILGAASLRKPVVVDGYISSAGALIASVLKPESRDYMILAHGSAEPGYRLMEELLHRKPLLDLGMRLGEGSGAAIAMPLLDAARAIVTKVATFTSAGVTSEGIKKTRQG